jgi:hypothetical protein
MRGYAAKCAMVLPQDSARYDPAHKNHRAQVFAAHLSLFECSLSRAVQVAVLGTALGAIAARSRANYIVP